MKKKDKEQYNANWRRLYLNKNGVSHNVSWRYPNIIGRMEISGMMSNI